MEKLYIGQDLTKAYHRKGIEELRKIVYGDEKTKEYNYHEELEGMRLFITTRQRFVQEHFRAKLQQIANTQKGGEV